MRWLGGIVSIGGAVGKVGGDDLIKVPGWVTGSWGLTGPVVALRCVENYVDIAHEWEGSSGDEVQDGTEVIVVEGEAGGRVE